MANDSIPELNVAILVSVHLIRKGVKEAVACD